MRYYEFTLNTTEEKIKAGAKINLREYCFDSPIGAVNSYMGKNIQNNMHFLSFREDGEVLLSAFSFNDEKMTLQEAYDHICDLLNRTFEAKPTKAEPVEITMRQYMDYLKEAKRREYITGVPNRVIDATRLWMYDYYNTYDENRVYCTYRERIAPKKPSDDLDIYDSSFRNELVNIREHSLGSEWQGNAVHYIISGGSAQVREDMAVVLAGRLLEANRLCSRRIELLSEIGPNLPNKENHFEDIMENLKGGMIVIDLSERFGHTSTEYRMVVEYIAKLFRKYCNKCLFVFSYNPESPGFSYALLNEVTQFAPTVRLKEGRGNRKAAERYLRKLIAGSPHAKYRKQAGEFLKLKPGDEFSQADVLEAFEQFGPWALNRNMLKAYEYNPDDRFVLDRDENAQSASERLEQLIGLELVKKQIAGIIAEDSVEKERKKRKGGKYQTVSRHMVFSGSPGTAKTTVAKLFAEILKNKGVLRSGVCVERGGLNLNDPFGAAVREAFAAANGGVLFIDEAYSLVSDLAITALIQEMEKHRDDVIVILAGYSERMKAFMERNEGLKSRTPHWIDFPDYTTDELTDIFRLMVKDRGFTATEGAVQEARYLLERARVETDFGNGRYVRNLIDRAVSNQSLRLSSGAKSIGAIRQEDLFLLEREDISTPNDGLKEERVPGTARKELAALIGLSSAKELINKAIANAKLNKMCSDAGIPREKVSLHMVFTGNPGTAKTTVARLFAEIMKDEGVLALGNFVEAGRADLIGQHVGETAPKVRGCFRKAQGGVLFIDEAYSLCDRYKGGYGDEAISTIIQEMENHREDVVVIFAGYTGPMQEFMERNPGMKSRIAYRVKFDDYTVEELCDITRLMVSQKHLSITDAAMDKLRKIYEAVHNTSDYGNGRFVRKMLEDAGLNLAERVYSAMEEETLPAMELLTTIEECDISDYKPDKDTAAKPIGFAV